MLDRLGRSDMASYKSETSSFLSISHTCKQSAELASSSLSGYGSTCIKSEVSSGLDAVLKVLDIFCLFYTSEAADEVGC